MQATLKLMEESLIHNELGAVTGEARDWTK